MADDHHDHDHSHDHDHGHDHDHDHDALHPQVGAPVNPDELDPGARALAEALSISFKALSLIMAVVVVLYLFSGMTKVREGEVAVRYLAGAQRGGVLEPGGYFWWPEPIGRVVRIDTSNQSLSLDTAFYPELRGDQKELPQTPLVPGRQGSLVTADQGVMHAKWTVEYKVDPRRAVEFLRNVGLIDPVRDVDLLPEDADPARRRMFLADRLVTAVAEQAIVHEAAQTTAEDMRTGNVDRARVVLTINGVLAELNSGLQVTQVSLSGNVEPAATAAAFQAATDAVDARATAITEARSAETKILSGAAGPAYRGALLAIEYYEKARAAKDKAALAKADGVLADLFEKGSTTREALAPLVGDPLVDAARLKRVSTDHTISGKAAQLVSEARSYATRTVRRAQADVERFTLLLPDYRKNPRLQRGRLWQDTLRDIFGGDVEKVLLPSDPNKTLTLQFDRDPSLDAKRRKERVEAQRLRDLGLDPNAVNSGGARP